MLKMVIAVLNLQTRFRVHAISKKISIVMLLMSNMLVAHGASFPAGAPITAADLKQTSPQLPDAPPAAVVTTNGNNTTIDPNHTELANFAWRQFIALSAPAKTPLPAGRGTVGSGSFITSGAPGWFQKDPSDNLTVWETYAHRTEMFPYEELAQPWGSTPKYVFNPAVKFGNGVNISYNNLDETSQIAQNFIFFPKTPGKISDPYYEDYQILFEAKVNQAEYDYVRSLRSSVGDSLPLSSVQLPPNSTSSDDSIEVKVAWRKLGAGEDSSRYHTSEVLYYEGDEDDLTPVNAIYALVGLHIIRKAEGYPNFIFTSFEHVDNLVTPKTTTELDPSGPPTGLYYVTAYNEIEYDSTGQAYTPTAYVYGSQDAGYGAKPPADTVTPVKLQTSGPLAAPTNGVNAPMAGPFPVVQPTTYTQQVIAVNNSVRQLINTTDSSSVWQYYQLKGVQYVPADEISSTNVSDAQALDFYLANNVIESSRPGVQLFKGGFSLGATTNKQRSIQLPRENGQGFPYTPNVNIGAGTTSGGCLGCHGQAKTAGGPGGPGGFAVGNAHNSNLETFLIANNTNQVYHNYFSSSSSSWQKWNTNDTALKSVPYASSGFAVTNGHNKNAETYLIQTDGTVYHNYYNGAWQTWNSTDTAVTGSPKSSAGFGVLNGHNQNPEVFLVAEDGTLHHNYYTDKWQTWSSTDTAVKGSPKATSGFAALNGHNKNPEVFLIAEDGTVYHNYYTDSWQTWSSTDTAVKGAPKAASGFAVENGHNGNVEAFLIGLDGTVYHNYYNGSWQTWSATDTAVKGAPKATNGFAGLNPDNSNPEVYLIDNVGGTVYHNYYTDSWQTWSSTDTALTNAPVGLQNFNRYHSFLVTNGGSGFNAESIITGSSTSGDELVEKLQNSSHQYNLETMGDK